MSNQNSAPDARGQLGIEGRIRMVRHDLRGLHGTGPEGALTFEDLWAQDGQGRWCPRHPDRVVEDRVVKNKFTRRGLGYFMLKNLEACSGNDQSKMPPEITYPTSGVSAPNPFLGFVLVGDNAAVTPSRPGDARVDWNESDGQFNTKISGAAPDPGNGTPGIGRRGIRIAETTGTLKRVQLRYPNASPNFEEHEYTFFAQANVSAVETGDQGIDNFVIKSIGFCGIAGGTPYIQPGYNEAYSFWGLRAVLGLAPTYQGISDRIYNHENYLPGDGSASGLGSVQPLQRFLAGSPGWKHANSTFASGISAGSTTLPAVSSAEFPTSGYPHLVRVGSGTGNVEDVWISNNDGSGTLTLDVTRHPAGTANAHSMGDKIGMSHGYCCTSEIADTTLLTYTGVTLTFNVTDKTIDVATAAFVAADHVRKTLVISGTANNNRDFTIKRRVSATMVEVFETIVTESPVSGNAVVKTRNTGDKAFDGRVENEGKVIKATTADADAKGIIVQGEKYVSTDAPAPHMIGRIFPKDEPVTIAGVRIAFPKGSIRDFCPDKFLIQTLNATHSGGGAPEVMNDADWTTRVDKSGTSQAAYIFDNGEYGYEYLFASPQTTCGVRLSGINSVDPTRKTEIAALYTFSVIPASPGLVITAGVNDKLKLSVDGGLNYKTFTCPAVASTQSVQTICDALNRVLYGYGLEVYRSQFGFLLLRATVGGNYSQLHVDPTVGTPINATLGLPTGGSAVGGAGLTQPLTKLYTDALTLIYTARMAGNLPKP